MQTERRVAANPQTKPTDLDCESAERLAATIRRQVAVALGLLFLFPVFSTTAPLRVRSVAIESRLRVRNKVYVNADRRVCSLVRRTSKDPRRRRGPRRSISPD